MGSKKKKRNGGSDPFGGQFSGELFSSSTRSTPMCHTKHPELKLGNGVLVGGSGYYPRPGFDVYVDLAADSIGMESLPWETATEVRINFKISDMCAPTQVGRFKKLVTYLCTQLQDGKRVHVGCFGGHGRTGMLVAAIYKELTGDEDAIQWAREHHCHKAVESHTQVEFLVKEYGTSSAPATKGLKALAFDPRDPFSGTPTPPARAGSGNQTMTLKEFQKLSQPQAAPKSRHKAVAHVPDPTSEKCVWR